MMPNLGAAELGVIAVICLLLFGGKQIPKIGRGIGEAIREFRNIGKMIEEDNDADD